MDDVFWRPKIRCEDGWKTYEEFAPDVEQKDVPTILFIGQEALGVHRRARQLNLPMCNLVTVEPGWLGVPTCQNCCGRPAQNGHPTCCRFCDGGPDHDYRCKRDPFGLSPYGFDPGMNMPSWEHGRENWCMDEANIASFGREIVMPRIKELALTGDGPSAIVCVSKGGDVTIQVVWDDWRGPTLNINASCLRPGLVRLEDFKSWYTVPPEVPLYLALGGNDWYFNPNDGTGTSFCRTATTHDRSDRCNLYGTWAPIPDGLQVHQIFFYFNHDDDHHMRSLEGDLLRALLSIIVARRPPPDELVRDFVRALPGHGPCPCLPRTADVVLIERDARDFTDSVMRVEHHPLENAHITRILGISFCKMCRSFWRRVRYSVCCCRRLQVRTLRSGGADDEDNVSLAAHLV